MVSRTKPSHNIPIQYSQYYSPSLLPKIAKQNFQIHISSILTSFISKIKLYDLGLIRRENKLIKKVKANNDRLMRERELGKEGKRIDCLQVNKNTVGDVENEGNDKNKQQKHFTGQKISSQQKPHPKPSQQNNFISPSNIPPIQNQNINSLLQTYQQFYEFTKIMSYRLSDLQQFIKILEKNEIVSDSLLRVKNNMVNQIGMVEKEIGEILGVANQGRNLGDVDGVREKCLIQMKDIWKEKMKSRLIGKGDGKGQNTNLIPDYKEVKRFKTQNQNSIQSKYNFLKRRSTSPSNLQAQKPSFSKPKHLRVSLLPSKFIQKKHPPLPIQILTDASQFPQSHNQTSSKNTQNQFYEDLALQRQQQEQLQIQKKVEMFKSQKKILIKNRSRRFGNNGMKIKQDKVMTWHVIEGENVRIDGLDSRGQKDQEDLKKKNNEAQLHTTSRTGNKDQLSPIAHTTTQRKSKQVSNLKSQQSLKKLQNQASSSRISKTNLSSRSRQSISTQNQFQNQKKYYGIQRSRDSKNNQQSTRNSKNMNLQKRKIRFGGFKKNSSIDYGEIGEVQQFNKENLTQGQKQKLKNRRIGKKVANQMNDKFTRIIQDKNLQKMLLQNQERQNNMKNLLDKINSKQKYESKLKRIKRGTETSISANTTHGSEFDDFSHDGLLRSNKFLIKKPKQINIDHQSMSTDYKDLLNLQKSLRPIAAYNQSKMIHRYSYQQDKLDNFQFKYKNGLYQFNHEFYIRNQDEDKCEEVEEKLSRLKCLEEEGKRFQFLNRFRKKLEKYDDPLQVGYG